MPPSDQLQAQLERLAGFEPSGLPVVSLYLDTRADQHGRDNYDTFLRRELPERLRTYAAHTPERESLEQDYARIRQYLERELRPAANALAVFASSGNDGLFEAVQLVAPLDEHWLYIADRPQLYPLARLDSQYPRYAAVLVDTSSARIFVFATGELVGEREVKGARTRGSGGGGMGGWSQSRYQRRIENAHTQLVKETVDVLDRVVRQEQVPHIILAGDDVALPLIKDLLPKHLAQKVIDDIHLPAFAAAHEVLSATVDVLARHNTSSDREKVAEAIEGHRSRGLGTVGVENTLEALEKGQVEELLISAGLRSIRPASSASSPAPNAKIERGGADVTAADAARAADELVTKAAQTGAKTTFIEDEALLQEFGGVAALLRFRIQEAF